MKEQTTNTEQDKKDKFIIKHIFETYAENRTTYYLLEYSIKDESIKVLKKSHQILKFNPVKSFNKDNFKNFDYEFNYSGWCERLTGLDIKKLIEEKEGLKK